MTNFKLCLFLLLGVQFLLSCSQQKENEPNSESEVLARVEDEVITTTDFRLNYEFGYPHLMRSDDPKKEYLETMVAELLLAKQGYQKNMQTRPPVERAVQTLTRERLIEEVFNQYVLEKIEISEDEIEKEVNKMAVSFTFSFLPAQSKIHAEWLRQQWQEQPLDRMIDLLTNDMGLQNSTTGQFKSDLTPATELDPALLQHLQDLELGKPSHPVRYQGQWYVFKIDNIVRQPLSPEDYNEKSISAEKIIYNRKAMANAAVFISELMEPLQVETQRDAFDPLADILFNGFSRGLDHSGTIWDAVEFNGDKKWLGQVYEIKDDILVKTSERDWSVEEVLKAFYTGLYPIEANKTRTFKGRLADVIGLIIRDEELLKIADSDAILKDPEVKRDIRQWENKWVFREMKRDIIQRISVDDETVFQFVQHSDNKYPKHVIHKVRDRITEDQMNRFRRDYLNHELLDVAENLKEKYDVQIHYDRLDTLTVSESAVPPAMTFQLLKQNSNRPALPVLDPTW
ncbi:MAG: hypothetical protein GVY07_15530 [Bacteroidetes bacterium]|jgi:hypothetical protein|nr:hypothetical protein [Bacteroidota bacterium]